MVRINYEKKIMAKQLTNRPIPSDMRAWVKELIGMWNYIREAEYLNKEYGYKWLEKNIDYYHQRVTDLLNFPPDYPNKQAWKTFLRLERELKEDDAWLHSIGRVRRSYYYKSIEKE